MSTGQMYSGKGETTTQNPQIEQTANNSTAQSSPAAVAAENLPLIVKLPDFLANHCNSEENGNGMRDLIKQVFDAALTGPALNPTGDHADFLREFEDSIYQLVTRGLTSYEATVAESQPVKTEVSSLADEINERIEQHVSAFGWEFGTANTEKHFDELISILQDEITGAFGGKPRRTPKSKNPNAKIIIRTILSLSLSRNSDTTLSEAELVQMALRKFQYDYTRKLVNYTADELPDYAARIAQDLVTADQVGAKLFQGMSNTIEKMNNSILGLGSRGKAVVHSGFEDNIGRVFQEDYIEYNDDPSRPGV